MSTTSISNRDRDCVACRVVSGSGLIGAGLYVAYSSKKVDKTPGKFIMAAVATGFVLLGTTRLLDLPPFKGKFSR